MRVVDFDGLRCVCERDIQSRRDAADRVESSTRVNDEVVVNPNENTPVCANFKEDQVRLQRGRDGNRPVESGRAVVTNKARKIDVGCEGRRGGVRRRLRKGGVCF